jgi:serine protease inhibitor ecotin
VIHRTSFYVLDVRKYFGGYSEEQTLSEWQTDYTILEVRAG